MAVNYENSKTIQKIYGALLAQIGKKPIRKIKIVDLVKQAGIGRSTFYKYYKDVDEVYSELKKLYLTPFEKIAEAFDPKDDSLDDYFEKVCSILEFQREEYNILLNSKYNFSFYNSFNKIFVSAYGKKWSKKKDSYLYKVFASAHMELLCLWVKENRDFYSLEFFETYKEWNDVIISTYYDENG